MSQVYRDFEREMDGWRRRYSGRPALEMLHLCLLSLEREEIVSVAYHEDVLARRLAALPMPPEVRDLARHALLWAWKDEEMHAIYIRGALLKIGGPWLRAQVLGRQMAGAVGGWAASVRQHVRWGDAPLSRAGATVLTWAGVLSGRVPKEVRRYLDYASFRDFCLFNVEAEKTAQLVWRRLAELAPSVPALAGGSVDDFRRVQEDEDRHRRIFQALADALDENDTLVAGQTAQSLAGKIGEVGEFFLPRSWRSDASRRNPVGTGAPVWSVQGASAAEKRPLFRRLVEGAGLKQLLSERARELGREVSSLRIAVKPTFMLGYHRRDRSIITDPELLEDLALYLRELGCADVAVVECTNIYDRFYRNRGVRNVAAYFGLLSPAYRMVDSSEEQVPHTYDRGMAQYTVGKTWRDADVRLSFAKMRSHPVEIVYLTLPNVEWMGGRCDQFLFLERQAHRETAIMMLLDEFPPHFALLDGYDLAADGLLGVMGCPRPKSPRRLYAGRDALAVDRVAGRHMGLKDPRQSTILRAAEHWFGDSDREPEVIGVDEPIPGWRSPYENELTTLLSLLAFPVYVLGSGRGAVFVPEMDQEAFPLRGEVGLPLRMARKAMRRMLGLSLPA